MIKHLIFILSIIYVCSFCVSCGILSKENYIQPKYYDLGQAEQVNVLPYTLEVAPFTCNGPYRSKMMYRLNKCHVFIDEYNRWIQAPNLLVTRYFQEAFCPKNQSETLLYSYKLVGDLVCFDINLEQNNVKLIIDIELYSAEDNKCLQKQTFSITETISEKKPEFFAEAMSAAARKMVNKLNTLIMSQKNAKP